MPTLFKRSEVTALELVALQIDANSKAGGPKHARALKRLELAKQLWRDKFKKMCPKCGAEGAHGSANTPLRAFVSDKILTVQIGVEVLEWASRPENGGTLERCKVDKRRRIEWAKDVISEMTREDEVGNSPLAQFLNDMMDKAAANGSAALCWPSADIRRLSDLHENHPRQHHGPRNEA